MRADLNYLNIWFHCGCGARGWPALANYNVFRQKMGSYQKGSKESVMSHERNVTNDMITREN